MHTFKAQLISKNIHIITYVVYVHARNLCPLKTVGKFHEN